jgi:plasmid stability protein
MKGISLKLPSELDKRLRARARRSGLSLGAVVREAVTVFLDDDGRSAPGSVAAAAADLAGCAGGPADLSTNREHLNDYGR